MPRRTFRTWPDSVPAARTFVTGLLEHVPPELCQTAGVLVSELATNAVRHAGTMEFAVEVRFAPGGGLLWIGITDTGRGLPIPRTPDVTSEHGRGLQLVAVLADRWGAHRRRSTGEKTVWFELNVPDGDVRRTDSSDSTGEVLSP
jgi:serine/threonine-protein kinase RsbW